nr:MATE family efflux transporter [uncultured Acetatifactor sp.]
MKLFQIVLNIAIGIAAGAQPIVGYNYGAKNYGRVKELLKLMVHGFPGRFFRSYMP